MKKFVKPEIDVKEIELEDVITTSTTECTLDCTDDTCSNFSGWN